MIARAKSVAARSMVMFKTSDLRFQIVRGRREVLHGRTTSREWSHHQSCMIVGQSVARLVVQLVVPPDDWWCHLSYDLTIGSKTSHDQSRLVARLCDRLYHQSLAPRDQYIYWGGFWSSGHSPLQPFYIWMMTTYDRSYDWSLVVTIDRTIGRRSHDRSYDQLLVATTSRTITYD